MTEDALAARIGEFDAIIVRSATQLTAELIERAERLRVIGRAGTGVDNVDVEAATKRGIIVVNAPESNSVAAAEHTLALALALFRNVPQAHASLIGGEWAALVVRRQRALREDARRDRVRPDRPARRPAGTSRSTWRCSPSTSSSPRSGSASSASRGRHHRRPVRPGGPDHDPPAEDAGDGRTGSTPRRSRR